MKIISKLSNIGGGSQVPDTIVIHAMSEYINGMHASDFLKSIGLSAHYLIEVDGSITKLRGTDQIAYHAKGHNKNTIGIEVLVKGNLTYHEFLDKIQTDYVTDKQLESLIDFTNDICSYWNIKEVVRHSDIDPKRKKDPGSGFPWKYFKSRLIK